MDGMMELKLFKEKRKQEKLDKKGKFAIKLIQFREKMGLSQQGLAARLDMSFEQINRYENGRSYPRKETLKKLRGLGFK